MAMVKTSDMRDDDVDDNSLKLQLGVRVDVVWKLLRKVWQMVVVSDTCETKVYFWR